MGIVIDSLIDWEIEAKTMSVTSMTNCVSRVLRLKHVQERVGLGRSTIYDRMNPESPRYDSTFPKPIKLGIAAIGWIEAEIDAWIKSRVTAGWGSASRMAVPESGKPVGRYSGIQESEEEGQQ
ncbi:Prophage CP4-57 regulatory protein (AlpA) [compost metagenome]